MLKGKDIIFRPLEISDLDILYHWENDVDIWETGHGVTPLSKFHLEQYIIGSANDIFKDGQLRMMICKTHDEPVGLIDLYDFDPRHRRAGVGIMISVQNRGKGYATQALDLIAQYARKTLNLHQLYCGIRADNSKSMDLFSRAGYILSGTRKRWILDQNQWKDEHVLQLIFD